MENGRYYVSIPDGSDDDELSDDDVDYDPLAFDNVIIPETSDEESNDENEEQEEPVSTEPSSSHSRFKGTKYVWKEGNCVYDEGSIAFLDANELPAEIKELDTPCDYFRFFFTDEILAYIVDQTNLYNQQKDPENKLDLTVSELRQFFGMLIYMSIVQLPTTRHYWRLSTKNDPGFRHMTVNRFERIKQYLHFVDSSSIPFHPTSFDKLARIRPLTDKLNEQLKKVPLEEYLAIDEQIIPTKAKHSLKQYNPAKPYKWGYKNFVLSGISGFSYKFEIYAGEQSNTIPDGCPDLGVISNVILRLASIIPRHLNYKLFFDNSYTGLPLMAHLHKEGILPLGTINRNRLPGANPKKDKMLPGAKLPDPKVMEKRGRGSSVEISTKVDEVDIHVTVWQDNKLVHLCSTYVGTYPLESVKRFSKQTKSYADIDCPKAVKIYNKFMGGVDLLDSMLGYYRIKVRCKRWYIRIFMHLIDLIAVNSWILFRRNNEHYLPLLDFKLALYESLVLKGVDLSTPTTRKRGRPSSAQNSPQQEKPKRRRKLEIPLVEVAQDGIGHLPLWSSDRLTCMNQDCNYRSFVKCRKCNVHLCFNKDRNCYLSFHQ